MRGRKPVPFLLLFLWVVNLQFWGVIPTSFTTKGTQPATITTSTLSPPTKELESPASFCITFSRRFRLGESLVISTAILASRAGHSVVVSFDLVGRSDNLIQTGPTVTVVDHKEVEFNIPEDASLDPFGYNYVRAIGSGGLQFTRYARVFVHPKALSIFIQTDRAVYQPGHTVKFRALVTQSDLAVLHEPMDVLIMDPEGNRIQQWSDVTGDETAGVVQLEMVTSLHPPLGTWIIQCTVKGVSERKTFKIEEYELPRFEVKLSWQTFALTTDTNVTGSVKATYTFGVPVRGAGTLSVKYSTYFPTEASLNKDFLLDEKGEAELTLSVQELSDLALASLQERFSWVTWVNLDYASFSISAKVKDTATDDVMEDRATMIFYNNPIKLTFDAMRSYYKPGLDYTAHIFVHERDGSRLRKEIDGTLQISVTSTSRTYPTFSSLILSLEKTPDNEGKVAIVFRTPPSSARFISIQVWIKALSYSVEKRVYPSSSRSGHFLQITPYTRAPAVGKIAKFGIEVTEVPVEIVYQVFARSSLVATGRLVNKKQKTRLRFKIRVAAAMAPSAELFVFYKREQNGEIILDSIGFSVDNMFDNPLSLEFDEEEVKPGEEARLEVKGRPDTLVFLLGVDKSVTLLGGGNDVTQSQVASEWREYGSSRSQGNPYYFPSFLTAGSYFSAGHVNILTDGLVLGLPTESPENDVASSSSSSSSSIATRMTMPTIFTVVHSTSMPATVFMTTIPGSTTEDNGEDFETPAARVRKFLPETWLWDVVLIGQKGMATFTVAAPDTITTWVTSAFAVHPTSGLTVASKRAELTTIRRLFVTLDLPSSAVRGEDVCITAQVVNHYADNVQAWLMLEKNATAFKNTLIKREDFYDPESVVENRDAIYHTIYLGRLQQNSVQSRVFCIWPVALGDVPLRVLLVSTKPADGVERILRVVPEGVARVQTYPVLLEVPKDSDFAVNVTLNVPPAVVNGSLRVTFKLTGDMIGPVLGSLENLLKKSYGCGEQNMINFAPNIYVINYLRQTNQLTPALLAKSRSLMISGYQQELRYRHHDGSFSAFGGAGSGSMWLTAFVVRCFSQASALGSDVISMDTAVISKAARWMAAFQNADGSFPEPGTVFNSRMQGGSGEGEARTAYVLIALAETEVLLGHRLDDMASTEVMQAVDWALFFLESRLPLLTDPYDVCIVTYALKLTNSSKAQDAISKMLSLANLEAGMHWERSEPPRPVTYSWYRPTNALNIEMTSYALLALVLDGNQAKAVKVARWLNRQRGPSGGFISTQDTVVGIQALTAVAALYDQPFTAITATVSWIAPAGPQSISLTLEEDEKLLLKSTQIPVVDDEPPSQLTIRATTESDVSGSALAEVVVDYNVVSSTVDQVFGVHPVVRDNTRASFILTTCVHRNAGPTDTMVEVDIGVPSGYWVNDQASRYGAVSSRELKQREQRIVLYYETMTSTPQCSSLLFTLGSRAVAHSQKVAITVSDYYNPDDEVTTYYNIDDATVCSVRPQYGLCQFSV